MYSISFYIISFDFSFLAFLLLTLFPFPKYKKEI